ncbi:MAG: undecaprenyldiphospho-muramoylpentapeptide beta-N-acetylglucosaminyltransferase [Mycobacteriales bacterium]|nr:undecaprenyldiphospho-muramoylpentapeptide beta-N-acetylglucosaminyltransferase [Frankia sp.]
MSGAAPHADRAVRVVLAGGGSAGHIEPALALGDEIRRQASQAVVTALGSARGLEARLVPARGFELDLVPAVPLPRRVTPALFRVPFSVARAVRVAAAVLDRRRADVVVGFGGYVALPAYLAARRRRIPLVVHEANARPGLANRVGARFASVVATTYPGTALRGARLTGIPLRDAVATLDRTGQRASARRRLGLETDLPTLLVFGGSQGARRINRALISAAAALCSAGIQVVHATGAAHVEDVRRAIGARATGDAPYVVLAYLDEIEVGYAAADLALCRAGAMTCAELTAVGLPAIYVPLPHGNGEQRLNADHVVSAGGGLVVDDAALTGDWVADHVPALLAAPERLAAMSAAARASGRPGAARQLAQLVFAAAGRPLAH